MQRLAFGMQYFGCTLEGLETKEAKEDLGEFYGVASTGDRDLKGDVIEPGAFGNINPRTVVMLRDHDPSCIIGGWTKMQQSGNKLEVEGKLLTSERCPKGRETYELLKHGFINGLSVGFMVPDPAKNIAYEDEGMRRRIKAAKLLECSIVAIPANPRARVGDVKTLARPGLAEWLRDSGFGTDEIEIVLTRGFDALNTRSPSVPDPFAPLALEARALLDQLKGLRHG